MKKLLIAAAAVATLSAGSSAVLAVACAAGSCTVPGTATTYVQDGFTISLSSGVVAAFAQDADSLGASAVHSRANYGYAGSTDGGVVGTCGDELDGTAQTTSPAVDEGGCNESGGSGST